MKRDLCTNVQQSGGRGPEDGFLQQGTFVHVLLCNLDSIATGFVQREIKHVFLQVEEYIEIDS